jgi:hypothetical protein
MKSIKLPVGEHPIAPAKFPIYFYRPVKDKKISHIGEPSSRPRQCQSKTTAASLTIIAAFVILTQGMIVGSEGQILVPPDRGSQAVQTQPSSLSLLVAQGRQHPGYQVFAEHLALPAITVVDEATLDVDGKMKIDVSRLDQLTAQQKETLAGQFEVPVGVIDKLLGSVSNSVPADATQVAGKLRATIIDYKYLLERWIQYIPPTGKEKVKADALLALQAGDIDKAWGMYADLPRPKPPTGFGVVGQN